ncbi:uncharacterized protein LOC131040013 [Cryptomeria japonica]|uniref:uncharacterized protein LOC131040013 n=1 Tax=Cryptomeria japonica TaxID=3369 RepID=UPI0027DA0387|nr:uncharacterized protein LOC131040013 [Cryptomeria japonica]XP_057828870.2 uncharacterized protein LOC131040013 [Cryptomeria japonica]
MAKTKKQNKKNGPVSMDMDAATHHSPSNEIAEAMDTSEVAASNLKLGVVKRNIGKKSAPKRRSQTVRKAKALEKALSNNEKIQEKVVKNQNKAQRTNTLKSLY